MNDGLNRFVKSASFKSIKRTDLEGDQLRNVEHGLDLDSGIDSYLEALGAPASSRQSSLLRFSKIADRRVSFANIYADANAAGMQGATQSNGKPFKTPSQSISLLTEGDEESV